MSMRTLFLGGLIALSAATLAAQQIVIDTFAADQNLFLVSPGTVTGEVDDAGSIYSTERNMRVSAGTVGPGGEVTGNVTGGAFNFTRTVAPTSGTVEMWWDGDNGPAFNPTGLGGVNLTANGQNSFRVTVGSSSSAVLHMRLQVWTDGGNNSVADFTLPNGGTVDLPYASFSPNAGAGADFTTVGAIFLQTLESSGFWVHAIDELRTTPVELASFTAE